MIRYYAYYSCGGYKDLYLGSSSLQNEYTYFLPLLATWQKRTKPEYIEKLRQIEGLQQIEVISKDNSFDFPTQAKPLFSHGGYRIIYLTLSNGDTCLCVRDITNGAKDEEDRDIPFNILITASGEDDAKILDQFCLDFLKQPNGFYELMSPLFSYDPIINGIKFHLGKLNSTIYDAPTSDGELEHTPNRVNFMVIDSATMVSTALNELNLRREQIDYIKSNDGKYSGSLAFRATSVPNERKEKISPTESDMGDSNSGNNDSNSGNNNDMTNDVQSNDVGSPTSEDQPVLTLNHETLKEDSHKQESIIENQSTNVSELSQQYSEIQRVLIDLTTRIEKISEGLTDSKFTTSSNITKILDQINSLKNDITKPLPTLSVQPKEEDSISVSKVHLWIAGVTLIVGFLLGALIF